MFAGNSGRGSFGSVAAAGRFLRRGAPGRLALALAAGALALSLAAPSLQAQVNPFGKFPGGMTNAQEAAMGKAIEDVLAKGKEGASETWKEGDLGGTATATKTYTKEGLSCIVVSHSFSDDDRNAYRLPFCKTAEGWKVYF